MTPMARAGPVVEAAGALRLQARPGEVGSLSGCPLCAPGHPPCLACRDTLRERAAVFIGGGFEGACWN